MVEQINQKLFHKKIVNNRFAELNVNIIFCYIFVMKFIVVPDFNDIS